MPSKKNKPAVEFLPSDPRAKPTKEQIVKARHTVVYEAPEVVQVPLEDGDEDPREVEFIEEAEQQAQNRQPSFRTKIRERFKQRGIGVDETLNLRIDRLPFFEQNGFAGVKADKEFCGVIPCTEKFFDGDEYLTEILRRYGPGEYWLTVRHKNAVVSSWREKIGGFPVAPVVTTSENGQPQIIYQQPGQPPAPQPTVKDHLREIAETIKLVDSIRGPREENPAPAPAMDPDTLLLSSLATNDKFMDRIGKSLVGKLAGGAVDDDPSWTSVAMKAIETGQATTIVQTVIRELVAPFRNMWGNNNGQTQMASTQIQNEQRPNGGQAISQGIENGQPSVNQGMEQSNSHANGQASQAPEQQQVTPEQQALSLVIEHCQRKFPPRLTFQELIQMEQRLDLLLNQHAMQTGQLIGNRITGYLDLLANTPVDDVLAFVKTLPNGEAVASLPHAKAWTEDLQKLIKESQQEESEAA